MLNSKDAIRKAAEQYVAENAAVNSASYNQSFYDKLNSSIYQPSSSSSDSYSALKAVASAKNGSVSASSVSMQDQALAKELREWQEVQNQKAMDFEANQALINRAFQQQSAQKAMDFEAEQAQINRDFQQMMSDTAYQRVVKDLKSAGLNPILAVNQGGSSSPSGSTASGFSSSGSSARGFSSSGSRSDASSTSNATTNERNASTNEKKYELDKQYAQIYATSSMLNSASSLLNTLIPW